VNLFIIDASVAAKWFLPAAGEPLTDEARELLGRYATGEVRFVVPALFWAELGNILWKAVRQGRLKRAAAESALAGLKQRNLPSVPSLELLEEAFSLAVTFDRTVYDCLYLALAIRFKSQLVTADERLTRALATHLPVKWLGAI